MRHAMSCFVVLTWLLLWQSQSTVAASPEQPGAALPNVILILADDLGAAELGCYGHPEHRTPSLDRMAADGVRFETFYAMPLCTPTRVALMTGQYGFHNGFLGMQNPAFKPAGDSPQADIGSHFTHADLMKSAGYATAQVGKWQLSGRLPTLVRDAGFDEYCMWAYDHNLPPGITHPAHEGAGGKGGNTCRYWHPCIVQNGEYRRTTASDYGPDLFNDFVLDFAVRHKSQPFFVYYTSVLTHGPHLETPDPANPGKRLPATFRNNLQYLDYLMGRLRSGLQEAGLVENTWIIFIGDNGTATRGKSTVTELGARVPGIVVGPGARRGMVSNAVADLTDIMPTLAEISGAKLPSDRPFDGFSLLPVVTGRQARHRDWIYSHLDDGRVLRDERWLLELPKGGGPEKFFDCGDSRNGAGYRNVTDSQSADVQQARARFAAILATIPRPEPRVPAAGDSPAKGAAKKGRQQTSGGTDAAAQQKQTRFRRRDQNGDGGVDQAEFLRTMTGTDPQSGTARFKKLDSDGNGQISLEEFLSE
ncbi:MAG: sulfatase-like hydrolase/transferase [Planctomyces sp.]